MDIRLCEQTWAISKALQRFTRTIIVKEYKYIKKRTFRSCWKCLSRYFFVLKSMFIVADTRVMTLNESVDVNKLKNLCESISYCKLISLGNSQFFPRVYSIRNHKRKVKLYTTELKKSKTMKNTYEEPGSFTSRSTVRIRFKNQDQQDNKCVECISRYVEIYFISISQNYIITSPDLYAQILRHCLNGCLYIDILTPFQLNGFSPAAI